MAARPILPALGKGSAAELLRCVEYGLQRETTHRLNRVRTWERARLYNQSIQWLEEDSGGLAESSGTITPFWVPKTVSEDEWYPMPVMNEISPTIQNEKARILGAGSKAYVRPKSSDTDIERSAKMSTDVLKDVLERLRWSGIEDLASLHKPLYGSCVFKSWWDLDYTKTVDLPVEGALRCPECGNEYGGDTIEAKFVDEDMAGGETFRKSVEAQGEGEDDLAYKLNGCVECGGPLVAFQPEYPEAKDVFGRGLFEPVPKGDIAVKMVPPYDYFPQNEGLDLGEVGEHYEEHIEPVEWIAAHYAEGHRVKPQNVNDMLRWHPIMGMSCERGGGDAGSENLFGHHAIVKEMHRLPWIETNKFGQPRLNRGRSVVISNNVVLMDQEYMIESRTNPGQYIPRVVYSDCPWEIRDGERWGLSLPELLFSLQDAINCLLSQVQDTRHRFGSPKILARSEMNIRGAGQIDGGYQGDIFYFDSDNPADKPELFGNTQMSGNVWAEMDRYIDAMARIAGTMDVEIGEAPKNVNAASAVMYLGEKASERRKARIARFADAKKRVYKHMLQLVHEMYIEPREYAVRGRNDRWEIKSFVGADLRNQTDVEIDVENAYEMKMFRREVINDGLRAGTISADTAAAKRRINEEWGVPREINEELNNQVEMAEAEFLKYRENPERQPAVDPVIDDQMIHFKTHSLSLQQESSQELLDSIDWSVCELALYGWEEVYDSILQAEEFMKMPAQQPQPGPDGLMMPGAEQLYQQQVMMQQQAQEMVAQYPKAPELRIAQIWQTLLAPRMKNPQVAKGIAWVIRFKAHLMAHFKLAQRQLADAGSGVPIPAAPGGGETVSGVVPGNPAQALPGPGAGMGAVTASGDGNA